MSHCIRLSLTWLEKGHIKNKYYILDYYAHVTQSMVFVMTKWLSIVYRQEVNFDDTKGFIGRMIGNTNDQSKSTKDKQWVIKLYRKLTN